MFCCKYIFFVINFLLFCLGLAIAGIGLWTLNDPNFWKYQLNLPIDEFYNTAYIAIVVGFVLVIIGFVGCCGAILDNACLLCLFSTVMIFLLLLGVAAALVVWIGLHNTTVRGQLEEQLKKTLEKESFFKFVEKNLKCCGVRGSEDYQGKTIPDSCKDSNGDVYKEGCLRRLEILLKEKAAVLGGMSATIAVLAIVASVIAFTIMCAVKRTTKAIV